MSARFRFAANLLAFARNELLWSAFFSADGDLTSAKRCGGNAARSLASALNNASAA